MSVIKEVQIWNEPIEEAPLARFMTILIIAVIVIGIALVLKIILKRRRGAVQEGKTK